MDKVTHEIDENRIKITGSILGKKYNNANALIILKSIKYEIGLKYPEYLPCLNKLNLFFYVFRKISVFCFK